MEGIYKIDLNSIPSQSTEKTPECDWQLPVNLSDINIQEFDINIIKSRYSIKKINANFYCTMSAPNIDVDDSGSIYVPYIFEQHTEESLKEYNEFMDEYKKLHAVCPKCGAKEHSTTLMGYPLYSDKMEEYKNLNRCACFNCGDKHFAHNRISIEQFNNINKNK